jgi:shikimate kinase
MNIFLIGPMGAGKTTIGKRLAKSLNRPFWDSDKELERRTGVDIPTIFHYEGEEGFRHRESTVLDELCRKSGIVLATGGGAVLRKQNRMILKAHGLVVYLRVSIDTQLQRTSRDRNRPLIQTANPRAKLEELKKKRDPLYIEVADMVLDSDQHSITVIVNRVIERFEQKA